AAGSWRPPLSRGADPDRRPPQTIISDPVQTVAACSRARGTEVSLAIGIHESVTGLYRPPALVHESLVSGLISPLQRIASVPVQTIAGQPPTAGAAAPPRHTD